MRTVEIEMAGDGKFMVGLVPEKVEQMGQGHEEAEKAYMRPAKNVDEALSVAKDMLTGETGDQAQQANDQGEPNEESDMAAGFKQAGGGM